jgi:MYXO-CTERM domain-containing protein
MSFQTRSATCAVAAAILIAPIAAGQSVIAGWSIPTAFPTGAGNVPTGTSYLPPGPNGAGVADQGANIAGSQLISVHALAAATYTSPAGNGSQYAFSSNVWKAGDYYQASFSGTGYTDLSFSWDFTRSTTGPATWKVIMSLDGGLNWSDLLSTYTPIINSASPTGAGTWSTTTYNPAYSSNIALGAIADNASSILVRVQATVDSVNSTGVYQAGGTARIDNVFINGTAVPAPGAIALLGVAGLAGLRRRR